MENIDWKMEMKDVADYWNFVKDRVIWSQIYGCTDADIQDVARNFNSYQMVFTLVKKL